MGMLSKVIDNDDMLRITKEFSRLGERCYLDSSGACLYPQSLIHRVNEDLSNNVYMNPHTDKYTRDCIEQIRTIILRHFNTNSNNHSVIFTSGSTQALKLVGESFQFANKDDEVMNCGSFVYLRDSHTSVIGLREIANDRNADIINLSHEDFVQGLQEVAQLHWNEKYKNEGNTLFVYPAESNFNGYKYPIDRIDKIKHGCLNNYIKRNLCKISSNWYVMLDVASYVPTNKLDLSKTEADFICLSFYKLFGFPTGLGALIVRNDSANILSAKRYFGGGTVDIVLSNEDFHVKRREIHERFEDGTTPFLSILAIRHAFDVINSLIPKTINNDLMETIATHTFELAKDLYNQLKTIKHQNGKNAAVLYMDSDFTDMRVQGAIVTFNLLRDDGTYIGYAEFQHMADLFNINVRTGCFCNSGSCQRLLGINNKQLKEMYKAGHKCGDEMDLIDGKPTGAVRASFAYYNTFNDVDKLVAMVCRCFIKTKYVTPKRKMEKCKDSTMLLKAIVQRKVDTSFMANVEPVNRGKAVLKEIDIYPIKSCGAYRIRKAWMIGPKGFEYDREWMIVKDNGVCLTQKQNTRMCLIKPVIDLRNNVMVLYFKGKDPISVPLDFSDKVNCNVSICQSKVCTDTIQGYDCGNNVAQWLSEALEISYLRLIRQSDAERVKRTKDAKKLLALSNQAQYLLINKATVKWLGDKICDDTFLDDVDQLTERFRGNIIVDMEEELVEKQWRRVIIGKHEFMVDGPCTRCQMVCIDQQTGNKTVEPLRTIAEQFGGKLRFGIYLTYVGPVDGSKDTILKINSNVEPIVDDTDISR